MTPFVQFVTTILSLATLLAQVYIVALVFGLFTSRQRIPAFIRMTANYTLELGLLISSSAFLLSLFYSTVAGFEACTLCWWQRIFIYPQIVLFAVAIYYKRTRGLSDLLATTTSLILSTIGGLIALYQSYAQTFNPGLLSACSVNGPSCAKIFFMSFGYITIPFMSLVSFALLVVIILTHKVFIRSITHV